MNEQPAPTVRFPRAIDLTHRTFSHLTVLGRAGDDAVGQAVWACRCSCGRMKNVRSCHLLSGDTKACGHLKGKRVHGHKRLGHRSPTYNSWVGMIQRCTNPNANAYPHYGGAGVKVCPEWMTFEGFLASMGERPPDTTLSRFGDTGNYEKSNCAWHTWKQQRVEAKKRLAGVA
jgi:hypothetical protein